MIVTTRIAYDTRVGYPEEHGVCESDHCCLAVNRAQVSAWLHACLCTWQWVREREGQRRDRDAEDEGRAWTTLHEVIGLW